MADIFGVIADRTRRDILDVLRESAGPSQGSAVGTFSDASNDAGELSVSEIVARLGFSQPTVSKHLKVLRDAGLVTVREDKQHRFYRLSAKPLEALEDWLMPFLVEDPLVEAELAAAVVLREDQRAIATAIGKAFADTAHQVSAVVKKVGAGR